MLLSRVERNKSFSFKPSACFCTLTFFVVHCHRSSSPSTWRQLWNLVQKWIPVFLVKWTHQSRQSSLMGENQIWVHHFSRFDIQCDVNSVAVYPWAPLAWPSHISVLSLCIAQQSAVRGISRFRPWHTKLNLGLAFATLLLGSTSSHCYVRQVQLQDFVSAAKIVEEIRFSGDRSRWCYKYWQ